MPKDETVRFRISTELLKALRARTKNISGYLRALVRADLEENAVVREIPPTPYYYHATLEEVVDGDTLRLVLDVGFEITLRVLVRLAGINSPEFETKKARIYG